MYISLDWLKDFVDIPSKITPEKLGELLTLHTVEIDGVVKESEKFKGVVVGKILEIKKHPNADKLQLAKVDVRSEILDIVCGATNIKVGHLVPVALVGAVLPNGLTLKETKIRGEISKGMMCAEDELGLGDDHSGIIILESRAKAGQEFSEYMGMRDTAFEVDNKSITNRPDLWSHCGIAREIAAFLGTKKKVNWLHKSIKNIKVDEDKLKLNVSIDDYTLCPRYTAVAIGGIKTGPSPEWMAKRLTAVGVRPINNIVDITNYVMLELGQPLHAFDADLLAGKKNAAEASILVRRANKEETGFTTLDSEERKIDTETLLITDGKKPMAIAGVMGGENSEIVDTTNTIIIESANFDFISIRKTSQKLGLRTEASIRFEKGLDPNLAEIALVRTVELVKEICPEARVISKVADAKKFKLNQGPIEFKYEWLTKFIGQEIPGKIVSEILTNLGFSVEQGKDGFRLIVPTWRATKDISIKEDIAEEVGRIYGYSNLALAMPQVDMVIPEMSKERQVVRELRARLSAIGMSEVYNYSFVGEEQLKKLGIDYSSYIRLANPIVKHQTMCRQNLAPNLLLNVKTNQARYETINLFEIGTVYSALESDIPKGDGSGNLPWQEKRLGLMVAADPKDDVFGQVKGKIEYNLKSFKAQVTFLPAETIPAWADKRRAAQINSGEHILGFMYELKKTCASRLGIKKSVAIAELNLKEIISLFNDMAHLKYQPSGKYPAAVRDIAFVVDEKVLYNDIRDEIKRYHEYIKEVELFDVYQGDKLGAGKKSLAFHIAYKTNKTLTNEEVDQVQAGLIKRLEEKFEAKIRNF